MLKNASSALEDAARNGRTYPYGNFTRADQLFAQAKPKFKGNWFSKARNKTSWLRDRVSGAKTVIDGSSAKKAAQVQKIIMDRVRRGGGTIVDHVGDKAIKFVDGGVSYFFGLTGNHHRCREITTGASHLSFKPSVVQPRFEFSGMLAGPRIVP